MPGANKKRWVLGGMTLLFLLIGAALFLYWDWVLQFRESTSDAYVSGNQLVITPQVEGFVETLYVEEADIVREGTLIASLNATDRRLAFEKSQHLLAEEVRAVAALFETVERLKAERRKSGIEVLKARQDYAHRKSLLNEGGVTLEQYEHAEADYFASLQAEAAAERRLKGAMAEVQGTTVETHPRVEAAKDRVRQAFVDLRRCRLLAPAAGMIARRQTQVGESVKPGTPLMLIIPLDQMWVEGNFKETQLRNVRLGQPVAMTSDFYGEDLAFHGTVVGLAPGTGSVFSVLPPQNATGNWIKIVQRLAVRISLNPEELHEHPLRLGLSMNVEIDTHDRKGGTLPAPTAAPPLFHTSIYAEQLEGVEELIAQIVRENT